MHTRELQSRIDALISDVEVLETTNASLKTKNFHQSNQIESINARVNELDATNQRIYNQLHEVIIHVAYFTVTQETLLTFDLVGIDSC